MYSNCVILLFMTITFGVENTYSTSYHRPRSLCIYPYVENGKPRMRNSGQLVRFSCQPQYTLIGTKFASCRNGHWDTPLPVCARSGCQPLNVPNSLAIPIHDSALVIFFCLPRYKMVGDSNVVYCNGSSWNGTAPSCVDETSTSHPSLSCDFESVALCGWVQDELHDFDWRRWSGRTPSSFVQTGPKHDHTLGERKDGHYMYIETSSREENDKARLISPVYDADLVSDGCFSFFYHMYGRNVGSLRVYQKPENVSLETVLNSTYSSQYLLFDKSGNMGDQWYQSVTPLKNFNDSFQIIFEGVRGNGFSSDIAIDDVAILTGENCTKASNEALSPFPILVDSCAGRCDTFGNETRCGCNIVCIAEEYNNCCHDFEDLCAFVETTTSSEMAPRTEKLVASTAHRNVNSTTTKAQSQTTIPTVPSTQHKVTTPRTTRVTTKKPTTVRATTTTTTSTHRPAPTTVKRVPTTIKHHTTRRTAPTTRRQTTVPTRVPPTKKPLTAATTTQSTSKVTTLEPETTTVTIPMEVTSKPVERTDELVDGLTGDEQRSAKRNGSASLVTGILLLVLVCCGGGYLFVKSRSSEGRLMWAKMRGRTRCDPEVRYITAEEEE